MLCIVFPVTRYFNLPNDHTFPGGAVVKNPPARAGDAGNMGSIPGSERSPGGGSSNPLQYSCLKNAMDRGAWWATVHRVAKELDTTYWVKQQRTTTNFWGRHTCFIVQIISLCMLVWASIFCLFLFSFLIKFLKVGISANTASEIKAANLSLYFNLLPLLCLSYDSL